MMVYQNIGRPEEIINMESEQKTTFSKGRPFSRQTGIFVFLGIVCIIIMILSAVIFSQQEKKFSIMESWMNSHTSDFLITGNDLEKKLQNWSSSLNMSGSRNPMTKVHEKKLSNIETSMTNLGPSLSSLASKQEENQQKLVEMSSSQTAMKLSVEELTSLVQALSYKLSTNFPTTGCPPEYGWIPFSNSCYLFSSNLLNWIQAKDYCKKQGALLLKIEDDSEKEWEFITFLAKTLQFWIGLTDETTGQWRWADDTPCTMNKVPWAPGQPDEWTGHILGEGEDCAHITKIGNINDAHCSVKMRFICKRPKDS